MGKCTYCQPKKISHDYAEYDHKVSSHPDGVEAVAVLTVSHGYLTINGYLPGRYRRDESGRMVASKPDQLMTLLRERIEYCPFCGRKYEESERDDD